MSSLRNISAKPSLLCIAKGFTLIEVMVAVAIIAMALPALMYNVSMQLDSTAKVRDKVVAQWVATNKMAEFRLSTRQGNKVSRGKSQGKEEMLGQQWYWTSETKPFPQPLLAGVFAVQIEVRKQKGDENPLFTLFSTLR